MLFPANARKPLRTDGQTGGRTDKRTDMPQNGHGWSDGPTDPCTGGKRAFQAYGQPENIMPSAPKGEGIKMRFFGAYCAWITSIEIDQGIIGTATTNRRLAIISTNANISLKCIYSLNPLTFYSFSRKRSWNYGNRVKLSPFRSKRELVKWHCHVT